MKRAIRIGLAVAVVAFGFAALTLAPRHGSSSPSMNNVIARELRIQGGSEVRPKFLRPLSGGARNAFAREGTSAPSTTASNALWLPPVIPPPTPGVQGCPNHFGATNIRVNQDCSLRRQAEEAIAVNPVNALNLIVGQNDSRVGYNHCGFDWSFDGGKTWGDMVAPFYEFTLMDGHTADACSDPSVGFDHAGNAYASGILFDVGAVASAIVAAKSNAPVAGRFFHSPAADPFQLYRTLPLGSVVSDNDPDVFNDKDLMAVDGNAMGPKVGNVYVVWTRFRLNTGVGVDGDSPIFFSQSTDGGATWSTPIEISGANPAICTDVSGESDPNACDQDQGAHPIVGADGTVYVAFNNGNTPLLGINQFALVSCPPNLDCSLAGSWTDPVKIAEDISTQPFGPDPVTGCEFGDQCLPPNGYRVSDSTSGSISVDLNGKLYFVWADFRNGGPACNPLGDASTATGPCNNDVFYAYSTDGGMTWSNAVNVTPKSRFGKTAQWQPWSAVAPNGQRLWIGYYDRSYGACESTGCNDITLAKVFHPATAMPSLSYTRLTTAPMPNLVPANNPIQSGFLGDYMWVATDRQGRPYVVWGDTRGRGVGAVEEDVYFRPPPGS